MRRFNQYLTYIALKAIYCALRLLPLDTCSRFCGKLARLIGPLLPVNKTARRHLGNAFKDKSKDEIEQIILGCWTNLGMVAAEFAHMKRLIMDPDRFEIQGIQHFKWGSQHAGVFLAGHLGNWELPHAPFLWSHIPIFLLARLDRNPYIQKFILKNRETACVKIISRTHKGGRELLRVFQGQNAIGALADQHALDGVYINFFGQPAKASTAIARLAIHYKRPLIPVKVERIGSESRFRLTFFPPLSIDANAASPETEATQLFYTHLENWIREKPQDWLWFHNRWRL